MVESPSYFHAVAPILEWFRKGINLRSKTLRNDLLSGERQQRVDFLQGVHVDISCLYKRELQKRTRWELCDPLKAWPDPEELELDASQQDAMRHILNSTAPLVQGPPGTGKSYIGVKAVQLLRQALDYKGYREPILLVCLTNHALDQFLEDLLDLIPKRLIRFGGRTKSEDQRLLDCQVHLHMSSSKKEFDERKKFMDTLEKKVANMDRLRHFIGSPFGKAGLLLAALPSKVLKCLLESLGSDELEAGLFSDPKGTPNPMRFARDVLWWWADGLSLEQVRKELAGRLPAKNVPAPVQVANRFAALDENPLEADWARILSHSDRLLSGAGPPAQFGARNFDFDDEDDESSHEHDDFDAELDEDEVEAVLDDRLEAALHGLFRSRRRRSADAQGGDADASTAG
mmetsp:Transcript_60601/g.196340  ORF Transcript_60601/g.196340 Transcript_60601/m.196340 type:complete len:401 (+) Transcript_60601:526-1728(+)